MLPHSKVMDLIQGPKTVLSSSLHVVSLPAWFLSVFSSCLPQPENMHVRRTVRRVNVAVFLCGLVTHWSHAPPEPSNPDLSKK